MGDLTTFAKRLKEARLKAGLTQAELAKKANTTAATISSYESVGGVKKASLDLAMSFAKALNVSLDWLCGIDDKIINTTNITDFSAKDYLYSLVRTISEMSCELQETTFAGSRALNIVITQYPLINFVNKIKDLLKVYRNGTLTEDLYETCVNKVVNDYTSYYFAYSNFLNDFEVIEAEQSVDQALYNEYETGELTSSGGVLTTQFFSPNTRAGDIQLYISEKYAKDFIKSCEERQKQKVTEKNTISNDN